MGNVLRLRGEQKIRVGRVVQRTSEDTRWEILNFKKKLGEGFGEMLRLL